MPLSDAQIELYSTLIGAGLVVLLILFFIISRYRKNSDVRKISKKISSLGIASIKDIAIPDEIDGFITIDYCILTPNGVLAIILQNYAGNLFGGDTIDSWTQIYQHKSFKFDNPLRHRQKCITALNEYLPGAPISAQIVFADIGVFPKGKPSHVSLLSDLEGDLNSFFSGNEPSEVIKVSWRKLEALKWSASKEGRNAVINT